jgi:hypothetical protein
MSTVERCATNSAQADTIMAKKKKAKKKKAKKARR